MSRVDVGTDSLRSALVEHLAVIEDILGPQPLVPIALKPVGLPRSWKPLVSEALGSISEIMGYQWPGEVLDLKEDVRFADFREGIAGVEAGVKANRGLESVMVIGPELYSGFREHLAEKGLLLEGERLSPLCYYPEGDAEGAKTLVLQAISANSIAGRLLSCRLDDPMDFLDRSRPDNFYDILEALVKAGFITEGLEAKGK